MNIDDLYKKLLSKFPSVSLATIYKNINAMVEKVFLSEVKIPNTKSVYELVKTEHAHFSLFMLWLYRRYYDRSI